MKFAIALLSVLVIPFSAFAQCGKSASKSGVEYRYCITPGEPTSKDVLYYMHGGGGDEHSWDKGNWINALGPLWQQLGYPRPTVITMSFGEGQWLLADVDSKIQPAYLPIALNEVMPTLEKQIGGVKGKRMVIGNSMGGYNGAELSLRAPDRFDRVALLCPGLEVVDPFLSDAEIQKFLETAPKSTKPDFVTGIVGWVREAFGTRENWERHNPQTLVERAKKLHPKFYVSCSKDDDYGFYAPAMKIAQSLSAKTSVQWVSIESGGHCAQSAESWSATAAFLAGK